MEGNELKFGAVKMSEGTTIMSIGIWVRWETALDVQLCSSTYKRVRNKNIKENHFSHNFHLEKRD